MTTQWAADEMQSVDLGDKRLNRRLTEVLSMLAAFPNQSIPASVGGGHNETTAAYRLYDNEKVDFEKILAPHIDASFKRIAEQDVVILAQDTTELDLTRPSQQVEGTGLLDGNSRCGEFLHPLIAFTVDGTPLGTLSADLWVRDQPEGKSDRRKEFPIEEKESYRWLDTQRYAQGIAAETPQTQFISVADSEADIYEVIDQEQHSPENFGWIIRSCYDRALVSPEDLADEQQASSLRDRVLQSDVLFTNEINVRGRERKVSCDERRRNQAKSSRTTEVEVRAATMTLRATPRPDRTLQDTTVNVVLVREIDPPADEEPVEWLLLTNLPIDSIGAVRLIIQYYCIRWLIEVFFRTLKSGCRVEERRFKEIERFERCLAVYMVVAWRTLYACRLGRELPDLSCEAVFEPDEWRPVYKLIRRADPPQTPPTLQEMIRMVAQLGGYVGRARKDEPGPQTTMLGMQRLYDICRCWRAFGPESSGNAHNTSTYV